MKNFRSLPVWALIAGGSFWGVVWYPFRVFAQAGIDGIWATMITYGIAAAAGSILFAREWRGLVRMSSWAWLMAFAVGWSNLGYVLAVLEGEVLRVLLLFYLAPLWTIPLARLLLDEILDRRAAGAMALAIAGAAVMLWRPELGTPWPASRAEWFAVGSGFCFALGNVLVRKLHTMTDAGKSLAIWVAVTVVGAIHLPWSGVGPQAAMAAVASQGPLVAAVGLSILAMGLALQYGLSRMAANRAIVILLVELPVAALAAWLLAGEIPRVRDGLGGMLIVAALLLAARK